MRYSRIENYEPPVTKGKKSSKVFIIFLIFIILAAVIYFIGAEKIGAVFNNITKKAGSIATSAIVDGENAQAALATFITTSSKTTKQTPKSATVSIDKLDVYALQVGSFDKRENAEEMAAELKKKGGAGYVVGSDNGYKVLIAGYAGKADAENVKKRLQSEQNISSKLYIIEVPKKEITVPQYTQATVNEALKNFGKSVKDMLELSISFDKGATSFEEAQKAVKALSDNLKIQKTALDETVNKTDNKNIEKIAELTGSFSKTTEQLCKTKEDTMSSKIKETYLSMAFDASKVMADLDI